MKEILSKNKYLIAALFVAVMLFYWFQIRPANIRKACNEETKSKLLAAQKEGKIFNSVLVNGWYRLCLVNQGMKPEDLLKE